MKNKKCTGLFLAFLIAGLTITPTYAASTQNKISDAQNKKNEAQKDLDEAKGKIGSLEAKKGNLEAYLTELNTQLGELSGSLMELQEKSDAKQKELQQIEQELSDAKERKEAQYDSMKLRIRYMYEKSNDSYMTMLLEAENFTDFLNKAENIAQITKYDRNMLEDFKATQKEIEEKEDSVRKEQEAIRVLQQETMDKQAEIGDLVKSTTGQIETYESQISSEESAAKLLIDKVRAQEDTIDSLMKQQKDEEAAAKLAAEKAAQAKKAQEEAAKQQQNSQKPSQGGSSQSNGQNSGTSDNVSQENSSSQTPEKEESTNNSQGNKYLGKFRLTAYCNCSLCGGQGLTASGTVPQAGRTVAMNGIPFGTKLLINGNVYTVEDRGTPYSHVDIYHNTHQEALNFGSTYADVYQIN